MCTCVSGLKLGPVTLVNWVTFCLCEVGLTQFIKYPGLTQILNWITGIINGICPEQSNELRVLDGDDGSVSPDSPQDILRE